MSLAYFQVVATVQTEEAAQELAARVVGARLAACAQVEGPIRSTYRWEGSVQTAREWRLTCKTSGDQLTHLIQDIRLAHPDEVPEITATPIVAGHQPYLAWIASETADTATP